MDGVVYWWEMVVGDVWTVWYTGGKWLKVMCGRCGIPIGTVPTSYVKCKKVGIYRDFVESQ